MKASELKEHIAQKSEQRAEIQTKLSALLKQRQVYIDAEQQRLKAAGKANGFDSQVNEMIRTQAAKKGIVYED